MSSHSVPCRHEIRRDNMERDDMDTIAHAHRWTTFGICNTMGYSHIPNSRTYTFIYFPKNRRPMERDDMELSLARQQAAELATPRNSFWAWQCLRT